LGLPELLGAVNDARAFKDYLLDPYDKKGLQANPDNIVCLTDGEATRRNILDKFETHFLDNPAIPDGGKSTMILFFAGHGVRVEAPGNSIAPDGMVEALCPVDERTKVKKKYVHAIPDYVLGWLLSKLAERKGPNIVRPCSSAPVFSLSSCLVDCDHGLLLLRSVGSIPLVLRSMTSGKGGMSRDGEQVRAPSTSSKPIPRSLDSHLWKNGNTAQHYRMWSPSARSHVLLAACREGQVAREVEVRGDGEYRGLFTKHLVPLLRDRLPTATYEELLAQISFPSEQTPHCGGYRIDRPIFNESPTTTHFLSLAPYTKRFRVEVGADHGVAVGTEFTAADAD
jgi:hypothetical protein